MLSTVPGECVCRRALGPGKPACARRKYLIDEDRYGRWGLGERCTFYCLELKGDGGL